MDEKDDSLPRSRFLDVTQRSLCFGGALRDIQKTAARETTKAMAMIYVGDLDDDDDYVDDDDDDDDDLSEVAF